MAANRLGCGVCGAFLLALALLASCFHPAYWKLPWFASPLRAVTPGEVVLVTGASTGIGRHAALTLAKQGFTVFCGVRRKRDGASLVAAAERNGIDVAKVRPLLLDVTNETQLELAAAEVTNWAQGRGLAALFNNAAIGGDAEQAGASNAVEHQTMAKYRENMEVNFFGTVAVTKQFMPLLREAKGRVVISSSLAALGTPFQSTYAASKAAVEGWADSLHREVMVKGIHVSILQLGFVTTPLLNKQAHGVGLDAKQNYDLENYPHEPVWWEAYFAMSTWSSPPTQTSEAVVHAVLAENPARRYMAGFGSEFMRITPRLPYNLLDRCFDGETIRRFFPQGREQVLEAIADSERDFEL